MLIGQVGGQRVALNRISGDPSQRRLLYFTLERFDLNDQGLVWPEVERLLGNDELAIEMCADRHGGSCRQPLPGCQERPFPFWFAGQGTRASGDAPVLVEHDAAVAPADRDDVAVDIDHLDAVVVLIAV